jgi:hypothetical protein
VRTLGFALAHATVVTLAWASFQTHGFDTIPHIYLWVVLGAVTLGAVSASLFESRGLVTPTLSLVLVFVWCVYSTRQYYSSLGGAAPATSPQPIWVYAVFWPLILTVMLLLAVSERFVRRHTLSAQSLW